MRRRCPLSATFSGHTEGVLETSDTTKYSPSGTKLQRLHINHLFLNTHHTFNDGGIQCSTPCHETERRKAEICRLSSRLSFSREHSPVHPLPPSDETGDTGPRRPCFQRAHPGKCDLPTDNVSGCWLVAAPAELEAEIAPALAGIVPRINPPAAPPPPSSAASRWEGATG